MTKSRIVRVHNQHIRADLFPLIMKLFLATLVLALSSASALKSAPSPASKAPASKLLSLRGGATVPEMMLSASAAVAITSGLAVSVGKPELASLLFLNLNTVSADKMAGAATLGWGLGKLVAVVSGAEAIKV